MTASATHAELRRRAQATSTSPTIPTATSRRTPAPATREPARPIARLFDGTYYYNYDTRRNRTAKFLSTTGALDDTATDITVYTYNNANEMTGVYYFGAIAAYRSAVEADNLDNGTGLATTMTEDAFGRMVEETTYTTMGESQTSGIENYIYHGENLVLVLNSSGQVTERELTGPAVDQVFASEYASTTEEGTGGGQASGPVSWYLTDAQGSVRDVVQGEVSDGVMTAQETVDHVIYDAYGNASQGSAFTGQPLPRFGFDGMRYDAATGFDLTATRPYDPKTGVWIQPDPIGFLGGQDNLSEFAGNDPANFVDLSGLAVVPPSQDYPPDPSGMPVGMMYVFPGFGEYSSGGGYVPIWGCGCCEGGGNSDPNVAISLGGGGGGFGGGGQWQRPAQPGMPAAAGSPFPPGWDPSAHACANCHAPQVKTWRQMHGWSTYTGVTDQEVGLARVAGPVLFMGPLMGAAGGGIALGEEAVGEGGVVLDEASTELPSTVDWSPPRTVPSSCGINSPQVLCPDGTYHFWMSRSFWELQFPGQPYPSEFVAFPWN